MEKRLKCTQKIVSIEELSDIYSPTLQNKIFPIKEFFLPYKQHVYGTGNAALFWCDSVQSRKTTKQASSSTYS
jgi:hypothetical protein